MKNNKKVVETPKQYDLLMKKPKEKLKQKKVDMDLKNWARSLLPSLSFIEEAECQEPKYSW